MWPCVLPILTMTDEEVFCVCYPTEEEPAFRRSDDRICYPGGTDCEVGPRNEGFNPGFLRFVYKLKEISLGHLYSRAPPAQVDGDAETIKTARNVGVLWQKSKQGLLSVTATIRICVANSERLQTCRESCWCCIQRARDTYWILYVYAYLWENYDRNKTLFYF